MEYSIIDNTTRVKRQDVSYETKGLIYEYLIKNSSYRIFLVPLGLFFSSKTYSRGGSNVRKF